MKKKVEQLGERLRSLHDEIGDFRVKAKEIKSYYQIQGFLRVVKDELYEHRSLYICYKTGAKLGGTMPEVIVSSKPASHKTREKLLKLQLININGNQIKDPDSHWIVDSGKLRDIKKRLLVYIDKSKKFHYTEHLKNGVKLKMINGSAIMDRNNLIKKLKFTLEFYEKMENKELIMIRHSNRDLTFYVDKSLIQKEQ